MEQATRTWVAASQKQLRFIGVLDTGKIESPHRRWCGWWYRGIRNRIPTMLSGLGERDHWPYPSRGLKNCRSGVKGLAIDESEGNGENSKRERRVTMKWSAGNEEDSLRVFRIHRHCLLTPFPSSSFGHVRFMFMFITLDGFGTVFVWHACPVAFFHLYHRAWNHTHLHHLFLSCILAWYAVLLHHLGLELTCTST